MSVPTIERAVDQETWLAAVPGWLQRVECTWNGWYSQASVG